MQRKIYNIPTATDTQLTLQIADTLCLDRATGKEKPSKELAVILSTEIGTKDDGEQVTTLRKDGIEALISKLTELKEYVTD